MASTLTALICAIYGTPEAAISAYVIFFINRADRTTSIVMSVAALFLVSLIIGLVIGLADFTLDSPMLRVACMAVLSAGLPFLTSASKLRPIGAIVAMIIGFGLDELGLVHADELATRGLLHAWLMVAIPIGANVVVVYVNQAGEVAPIQLSTQCVDNVLARKSLGEAHICRKFLALKPLPYSTSDCSDRETTICRA